jgi:hypothetical protein
VADHCGALFLALLWGGAEGAVALNELEVFRVDDLLVALADKNGE